MIYSEQRPWGTFEVLFEEETLKIKRITVKPGNRLSLQSHRSRAENWTVIQGTACVQVEENTVTLSPYHSVFIPQNAKHRVENRSVQDLVFIEIQTGSYLGEDDIIRYEDDYNRIK